MVLLPVVVVVMLTVVAAAVVLLPVVVVMVLTVVTAAAMTLFMMVVMMFFLHLGKVGGYICLAFHSLHDLSAGELVPRGSYNRCLIVMLTEQFDSSVQLLPGNTVCTG